MGVAEAGLGRINPTGATPQQKEATLKNGDVYLQNISVSDPAIRNTTMTVSVTASNALLSVFGSGNPDCCGSACGLPGAWQVNGLKYEVMAEVAGNQHSTGEFCLGTTEIGTFDRQHAIDLPVPGTVGDYVVTLTLRLTGSGQSAQTTRMVRVAAGDGNGGNGNGQNGQGCASNADCPDGQVCQDGQCVQAIFGIPQNQALIAGAAVVGVGGLAALTLAGLQGAREAGTGVRRSTRRPPRRNQ